LAGDRHAGRVGVSLLTRVGLTELIAQTPEEYVKLAVELADDTGRLVQLRAGMRERMKRTPLCDAKTFTRDLEVAYREMWRGWCVMPIQTSTTEMNTTSPMLSEILSIPGKDHLHIGGLEKREGWKLLNIKAASGVDYVGDIRDLSQFANESFDTVYGSHVLEHVGYQKALGGVIRSIHRILRPGGKFFVSVPDLDTLCRLFVDEQLTPDERLQVMRMIFGGQTDEHDFHYVGLNAEFLAHFLNEAGFREIHRPPEFNIFHDTSSIKYRGLLISLNMVAIK
jgi:predicted SAM-dependent methyltransferase